MALTYSRQVPLGSKIPPFKLPAVDGKIYSVEDFEKAPILVVMFICNHCPYVQAVEERILKLARDFEKRGVQFVAICSNDPTDYPDDRPENLLEHWREKHYGFPYLIDESQEVACAFQAVCTPDIFVYDRDRKLAYRGRIDDHWQSSKKVKREELREALEALIAGRRPQEEQFPSMGCSIKWIKTRM